MRFLATLILLLLLPAAMAEDLYNRNYLILDSNISTRMTIVAESSSYKIQNIMATLSFFPRNEPRQEVIRQSISPEPDTNQESLIFTWKKPKENTLTISIDSRVKVDGDPIRIYRKVDFPIIDIPDNVKQYVAESETIDFSDQKIRELAQQLASGETDQAIVVHKLAEWTNKNIKYELNTITSEATQKASWVLANREGVCDELTNLFIALCRSLGIPARFVSGVSYTTSELFTEPWSPHGWAEVYYPGYGWVPYDVTYGEFGYINPTHLSLKKAVDSNRTSTKYEWEGYNAKLETTNLKMITNVVEKSGFAPDDIKIEAKILKRTAGFGSHNLVEAEITNLRDHYISRQLSISSTNELMVLGERSQFIILPPLEKRKLFWTIKSQESLDPRYVYTFLVSIYSQKNESGMANFTSNSKEKVYSLSEIREYYQTMQASENKIYSNKVALECTPSKREYYEDELVQVTCKARNIGNVMLENLSICFYGQCENTTLGISQQLERTYTFPASGSGIVEHTAQIQNKQVAKLHTVQIDILDKPKINITELTYPAKIKVSDPFTIEFRLSRMSSSIPEKVKVRILGGVDKEILIDRLDEDRKFVVNVDRYTVSSDSFRIIVEYQDGLLRRYSERVDFTIEADAATLSQKAALMLNRMDIKTGIVLLVAIISFVMVTEIILFVKRRR